mmetsp:Transcript_125816/g.355756  ORF Transcript_125816/g.355756 Transcript_125816/m.355756 type:complete len:173 (+) Transcript_125816:955-1473(+)
MNPPKAHFVLHASFDVIGFSVVFAVVAFVDVVVTVVAFVVVLTVVVVTVVSSVVVVMVVFLVVEVDVTTLVVVVFSVVEVDVVSRVVVVSSVVVDVFGGEVADGWFSLHPTASRRHALHLAHFRTTAFRARKQTSIPLAGFAGNCLWAMAISASSMPPQFDAPQATLQAFSL